MDDRTRFKLAGFASYFFLVVWVTLVLGAVAVLIGAVRAILAGRYLQLFALLLVGAALYGLWYVSTSVLAGLITNNTKGYRPWEWGMVPRNEHGESAQRFNIPLSHSEVFEAFIESSDPRVQAISCASAADEQSKPDGEKTPNGNAV